MRLRNIDFGNILGASGVQGFFGEGYWFHTVPRILFRMNLSELTFVAKTVTLRPRKGNMRLTEHHTPRELFPDCVRVNMRRGVALNAVGLSNPGLDALLGTGKWCSRAEPFLISVTSLADTLKKRTDEFRSLVKKLGEVKETFSAPFGVQINLSCPNTDHTNPGELIKESEEVLRIAETLNVPLMPKYSITSASVEAILRLNNHPGCDAVCVSNTIPFGWDKFDWRREWGSETSPLETYGGGGLSGGPLCVPVCEWIMRLRDAGFTKPVNGGGGILRPDGVNSYRDAGASSVFLGSAVILRPWRVRRIIERANGLHWKV